MRNNCVPFVPATERVNGRRRQADLSALAGVALGGASGPMSAAQCAFLSGVIALLAAHGEDALTKSCKMVLERFGRRSAS